MFSSIFYFNHYFFKYTIRRHFTKNYSLKNVRYRKKGCHLKNKVNISTGHPLNSTHNIENLKIWSLGMLKNLKNKIFNNCIRKERDGRFACLVNSLYTLLQLNCTSSYSRYGIYITYAMTA